MNAALTLRAQQTTDSLQSLHQRLEDFEDRFADAAVERLDQVPLRIEQKIAARLQARQEVRTVDLATVFEVTEFS
jgi:hypothetical protein